MAAGPAGAQTITNPLNITTIRTGFNVDSFALEAPSPLVNPAGCPTPDGYLSAKPAPGYNTYYDAAKLAFETKSRVQVIVANRGCTFGRPEIIGINVLR